MSPSTTPTVDAELAADELQLAALSSAHDAIFDALRDLLARIACEQPMSAMVAQNGAVLRG